MKRMLLFLCGALLACSPELFAQATYAPPCDPCIKKRLPQTIGSLRYALESGIPGLQATAAQTVRDLKANIPEESFSSLVIPLMRIVKDENADHAARILAAFALHDLNSPRGDFAIGRMAVFSQDKQVRYLCGSLTAKRMDQEMRSPYRDINNAPVIAETK
jgi:hypothetical protein